MNTIYRNTLILSAIETFATRALVTSHYLLLTVLMGAERFGQISAWYSTIFLCLTVSSSGIITTLTLSNAYDPRTRTMRQLLRILRYQWRFIIPLAIMSMSILIYLTPLHKTAECIAIAPLAFLMCLAYISKKQLGHALKLNKKQSTVVCVNIGYHTTFMVALCGWHWYFGTLSLLSVMSIITTCSWLTVLVYILLTYKLSSFDMPTADLIETAPRNHLHHIAIDISKLLFSPNTIVLLVYSINGPAAAGFVKALHGASQLFLSSSSRLVNTATHINYALSADHSFIARALSWAIICGGVGIAAMAGCLFMNAELCSFALQYTGFTAALLALFGTNQVETMLQFSLASKGQSHIAVAITLLAVLCIGISAMLMGGIPTQMGSMALLFLAARCVSLSGLIITYRQDLLKQSS